MKLLISSITKAEPEILRPHLETIRWQTLPPDVEVEVFYLVDPDISKESIAVLEEFGIEWDFAGPKPENAAYGVEEETHRWNIPTFHWLAHEKQHLLDVAKLVHADRLLLVDSDLLLEHTAINSLLAADKPVVSGVFWTRWNPSMEPLPQVWLQHPYILENGAVKQDEFLRKLAYGELVQVGGLGAFTMIRRDVFDQIQFWPLVEGLPNKGMWQGEDRHFCVHAARNHVELWADGWPLIFHVYRPSDVKHIPDAMKHLQPRPAKKPEAWDWVSLKLHPMEEEKLLTYTLHLRGRLGNLELLPELQEAIARMYPGEEAYVKVYFPDYWPNWNIRGKEKVVQVTLVDVRPPKQLNDGTDRDEGPSSDSEHNGADPRPDSDEPAAPGTVERSSWVYEGGIPGVPVDVRGTGQGSGV